MDLICCPNCQQVLDVEIKGCENQCSSCGYHYQYREGIIDFIPTDKFYWGEINEEEMVHINNDANEHGWFNSIRTNLTGKNKRLLNYILEPLRYASIFHFFEASKAEACLDLGSGWGQISFGLSRFFKQVYSLDGVYERLRFQSIRAKQSGINNIRYLRSTMMRFPIPDNSMDVVIINGLLEWIGLSGTDTSPAELQKRFLQEVHRVLKPDGRIMVGIENRYGLQYFMGGRDHSGLRFTSLMPRKLASLVVKNSKRGKDALVFSGAEDNYRTLTYSYWGYKRLLEENGFQGTEIYWAWSGYNYPRVSGTVDGESIKYYLGHLINLSDKRLLRTMLELIRLAPNPLLGVATKLFSPHFLIISGKEKTGVTFQDTVIKGQSSVNSFIRTTLGSRTDLKTTYHCLQKGKLVKVASVTEEKTPQGSKLTVHEAEAIEGRTIRPYDVRDLRSVGTWLAEFQKGHTYGHRSMDEIREEAERIRGKISQCWPDNKELHNALFRYLNTYCSKLSGINLPIVCEHGDFTPPNILKKKSGEICAVDWEHSLERGNPLMDIGGFYLSLLRRNSELRDNRFVLKNDSKTIDAFCKSYQASSDTELPLKLSPAYYLLRIIVRELEDKTITPENFLFVENWLEFLPAALSYAEAA